MAAETSFFTSGWAWIFWIIIIVLFIWLFWGVFGSSWYGYGYYW
ncbi:hypothetical protein [Tepidibacillus sp. LV47]